MEARASFSGAAVSKTVVAGILVLVAMGLAATGGYVAKGLTSAGAAALLVIVALGLAAMGGYIAKGLSSAGAAAATSGTVHAAPGSVLRQDNPKTQPVIVRKAQPSHGYRELE